MAPASPLRFEPLWPDFMAGTVLALGFSLVVLHREDRKAYEPGTCASPVSRRRMKRALWIATIVAISLVTFPWWSRFRFSEELTVADRCFTPDQRDLTGRKVGRFVLWQLPLFVFVAGSFGGTIWHTILWTTALTVAGTACIVNAARCGRLHCYFTGPFFLLGAVVTLTYGLGVLQLGPGRWGAIGLVVAVGSWFFVVVPEWRWGKYVTRARPAGG